MARRWMALMLCVVAAACSKQYSEAEPTGDDDDQKQPSKKTGTTTTTTNDAGAGTPADSGTDAGDAGAQACTTCPCAAPATTPTFTFPPSAGQATPCTEADLTLYLANESKTFDEAKALQAAQNANCAACIFTRETDTNLGPVVATLDGRRFVNFGLCYAIVGAREECAQAADAFEWCRQKTCNVCVNGENPPDCEADIEKHACADSFAAANDACGYANFANQRQNCLASGNVVGVACAGQ